MRARARGFLLCNSIHEPHLDLYIYIANSLMLTTFKVPDLEAAHASTHNGGQTAAYIKACSRNWWRHSGKEAILRHELKASASAKHGQTQQTQ